MLSPPVWQSRPNGAASAAPARISDLPQIGGRSLSAILLDVETQLLALPKGAQSRTLDGRDVHEHILGAVVGLDKAVALLGVEPLHCSARHLFSFERQDCRRATARRAEPW